MKLQSLAYFGAKILHPTCIWPAQQENVPVRLLNTMQPDAPGTVITKEAGSVGAKAVAAKDTALLQLKLKVAGCYWLMGSCVKVFEVFEKYKTSIDMITTSEVAVSVTIDSDTYLNEIVRELEPFGSVDVGKGQTIVSIVGNEIAQTDHVLQNSLIR